MQLVIMELLIIPHELLPLHENLAMASAFADQALVARFSMAGPLRDMQSKAWSCESLLRGSSFLASQSKKKNITPLDAIKVAQPI